MDARELQTMRNLGYDDFVDLIERQAAENASLKTVMVAAAEEIHAHWDAHCDSEGYGPQNLMRRLEEGIPSEYGYTAGAFAALRADAERYRWLRGGPDVPPESNRWARWEVRHWCGRWWNTMFAEALDAAIDAARTGGGK